MHRISRFVRIGAAILVAGFGLVCGPVPGVSGASALPATASGPCTGTINGVDVATVSASDPDDAIQVDSDGTITAEATSSERMTGYRIELEYADIRWTIAEGSANGTSWSATVNVDDYARFGVGLYRVHAVSFGDADCEGSALIEVSGSPFGTIAGWAAVVMVAFGVAGVAKAALRKRRRLPLGEIWMGLLGGLGVVVLLQQFGLAYPTRAVLIVGAAIGAVVPLAAYGIAKVARRPRAAPSQSPAHAEPLAPASALPQGVSPSPLSTPAPPPPPPASSQQLPPNLRPAQVHAPAGAELAGFAGDHVVGPGGLQTFGSPDASAFPGHVLQPGVEFRVSQNVGEWVLIECTNGWTGWAALTAVLALRRSGGATAPSGG